MKRIRYILWFVILFGLLLISFSCPRSVDSIIRKYDNYDFSALNDRIVTYRSRGANYLLYSRYIVYKKSIKTSPYCVDVNDWNNEIVSISNHLVMDHYGKDYLTDIEIRETVTEYVKHSFFSITVDIEGNVWITVTQQGPSLLRKVPNSDVDLKYYRHYKGNWYILN